MRTVSNTMRITLISLGFAFIFLGIFLNFQLYTSLAPDGETVFKSSYGLVGILLDISKITLLSLGALLFMIGTSGFIYLGSLSIAGYVVLTFISFSAGWGFSLIVAESYESNRAKSSYEYQNYSQQLEKANERKAQYAQFASIDTVALKQKMDSIKNSLDYERNELANCPTNYITHCVNPAKTRIAGLEKELAQLNEQANGYNNYVAAQNLAGSNLTAISNLDSGKISSDSTIHPLFIGMGQMFGIDPVTAKYRFTFLSFLMVELLGAFLFVVGTALNRKRALTYDEIQYTISYVNEQRNAFNSLNSFGGESPAIELKKK